MKISISSILLTQYLKHDGYETLRQNKFLLT
jgi:hypothetical protein